MNCPSCGTESAEGAKFCPECGHDLSAPLTCPSCSSEVAPAAKFCPECGHNMAEADTGAHTDAAQDKLRQYIPDELLAKLESARSGAHLAGERRTVTMLFCDVQGSTAAAESMDPEDWADIINGAFEHLIRPVYRYEGTLARLMGDAILAFFGAPIAHEDDPERAILAGLDIIEGTRDYRDEVIERWGIDFDLRIGINTGLVVVGEVGSDLRVEYTAMGDAVNLASRMESTADAGTIRISEHTRKLVAPLFDLEDLGPVEVKGKARPVGAYRVIGPAAKAGSKRGIEGLHSPVVGRDAERATIRSVVDDLRAGRGAVCSVIGDAGLGKSRLVTDLLEELQSTGLVNGATNPDGATPEIHWIEGQSFSYQTGTAYAPFIALLDQCLGILVDDDDPTRLDKVRGAVDQLLPGRQDELTPYVATLLGLPLEGDDLDLVQFMLPPELRPRVFGAVADLLGALASQQPLVVVLEDLHWADSASIELAEHLMPLTDSTMFLLLALFRPRREDASWRFHETADRDFAHRYTRIELGPLDEEHGRALVANLLEVEGLPESMRALILEKAEGNPFFVEEVIRSLLDAGVVVQEGDHFVATHEIDTIAVPDNLSALLVTRLDHLDDATKIVIFTAAVIGRDFDVDTLASVTQDGIDVEAALSTLQRRQLIRETARLPRRTYRFKHGLTQSSAYESSLLRTRRDVHGRLAERLEEIDPGAVQDLARHWLGADQPDRAVPHLVAAGELAFGSYSVPEAVRYLRQAIDLLDDAHDAALGRRAYEALTLALAFGQDVAAAKVTAQELIDFGRDRDDVPSQIAGFNKLAFTQATMTGETDDAVECLVQAQDLAGEVDDRAGMAEAHMTYCFVRTNEGDLETALTNQLAALELGDELGSPVSKGFGLVHYANTLVYLTRYDDAAEAAAKARAYAEESGQKQYLAMVLGHTEPFLLMRDGRMEEALAGGLAGVELAGSIGATIELATCLYTAGQAAMALGRWEQALELQDGAYAAAAGMGMGYLMSASASALATVHANLGDADPVMGFHDATEQSFEAPLGNALASAALAELGFCALGFGEVDAAGTYFERGLSSRSAASHLMKPMLLVGQALVTLMGGDAERAGDLVAQAATYADEREMTHMAPLTAMGRGQIALATGDVHGAIAELTTGEELARAATMWPMVMNICGAAAQAHTANGDDAAAGAALERRAAVVEHLAEHFTDDFRRDLFRQTAAAAVAG